VIRGLLNISEIAEVRDCLDVLISEKIKVTLGHLEGNPISGEELAMLGRTVRIGGPADSALIGFPGLLT
tara:strand:- start:337 stop:543 length:207 start_codon:yes stop_codon:yes gene_type:complete